MTPAPRQRLGKNHSSPRRDPPSYEPYHASTMRNAALLYDSWDQFATSLDALHEAYGEVHGPISREGFVEALREGLVLYRDLDLSSALAACPSRAGPDRELAREDEGPIRTKSVQGLLDELCSLTMEDPLTGLFNRRYFEHRLRLEGRVALRTYRPLSVMMIDVDHFKKLNDRYGHAAGDETLRALGQAIRSALRASDEVTSRYGGEEFAVLLPDTNADGILVAAERVRRVVEDLRFEDWPGVTVSIGTATLDPAARPVSPTETLDRADRALYAAKQQGRNRVRRFEALEEPTACQGVSPREKDALLG